MVGKVFLAYFLLLVDLKLVEPAPLSLRVQFQTALQQVAELNGNNSFEDCCDVSVNTN